MGKMLEGIGTTTKLVHSAAYFSESPWTENHSDSWEAHYTLALALEVKDARVGDIVIADSALLCDVRGFYDARYKNPKVPGSCFCPVFCRVGNEFPKKTILDAVPGINSPAGYAKTPDGQIFIEDSGENIAPSGVTKRTNGGLIGIGRPYYRDVRHWQFVVWQVPVWLLVWVAPRSTGSDRNQCIQLPDDSNYSKLTYQLYR